MFNVAAENLYEERQCFSPVYYLLLILPLSLLGNAVYFSRYTSKGLFFLLAAIVGALLLTAVVLNASTLVTRILPDQIEITLGKWVPFFRKRIMLQQLHSCRAVKYHPLLEAGGWGIRRGRFEGIRCWYYNARGKEGVLLEGENLRCIIGSQVPEQLAVAILQGCAGIYS